MVSPFMAFSKGVFQGYNEMRQQEKEFLYEMELLKQKGVNDAAKIEGPNMFTIMGQTSNGTPRTYELFPKSTTEMGYGSTEEREQQDLIEFYQVTNTPIGQVIDDINIDSDLTVHDWLQTHDKVGFTNMLQRHDVLGRGWVRRNTRKPNEVNGRYQYSFGEAFALQQGHPLGGRFLTIAKGEVPISENINTILHAYWARNGAFIDAIDAYGPGYGGDKNTLFKKMLEVSNVSGVNMGLSVDEIIDNHTNKYGPLYWQAYLEAEDHFKNVRFSNGQLDQGARHGLMSIIEDPKYSSVFMKKDSNGDLVYNFENINTFFRMGSRGSHQVHDGMKYFSITDSDDFIKSVLRLDGGIEDMRSRASSSLSAITTINMIENNFPLSLQNMKFDTKTVELIYKNNKRYNLKDEDTRELFFTGIAANLVEFGVGILSVDGAWSQIKQLVTATGLRFENGEEIAKANFMDKLVDSGGNISIRKMLNEVSIYQVATALQGGTGGRTISDQDVARVSNALGYTLFSTTPRMQYIRLQTLKRMMRKIYNLNSAYATARDVQGYKAADLVSQMMIGQRIDDMDSGSVAEYIKNEIEKEEQVILQSMGAIAKPWSLETNLEGITEANQFIPKGWTSAKGQYDTEHYEGKTMTPQMEHFIGLSIEEQRSKVTQFNYWQRRNAGLIKKSKQEEEEI